MSLSFELAKYGMESIPPRINPAALGSARKMTLDTLGCLIAGRTAPGIRPVVDQMLQWGGKPESEILAHGRRLPAPNAAFVNSAMIHALDYDDVYIPASLHLTSVIVPTALAVAELSEKDGSDFLEAFITGVEVAGRLGRVYQKRRQGAQGGGFLPSSIVGGFGAVAAAAILMGLTPEECGHAMGINYAQISGNRQALHDKSLTKRLQPAFAARSAIWATMLAQRGITGPVYALEGKAGLFRLYQNAGPPSVDELLQPGDRLEIERVTVKRYTSCGACHSSQEAAERLKREEGLHADEIAEVEICGVGSGGLVGNQFEMGENPQLNAQFSVQYCVAYALLRGRARLDAFTDEAVRSDREVAGLAKRIKFTDKYACSPPEKPAKADADTPGYALKYHAVIVTTKEGRKLQRGNFPCDYFAPENVAFDDVKRKFWECSDFSSIYGEQRTEAIVDAVAAIDCRNGLEKVLHLMDPCDGNDSNASFA